MSQARYSPGQYRWEDPQGYSPLETELIVTLDEIAYNARNLLHGGLPHYNRERFARAVLAACCAAITAAREDQR